MVVVRWLGRRMEGVAGFAAWDCEGCIGGFEDAGFELRVPVARTWSRILLVVGAAGVMGVGCCGAAGFGAATGCSAAFMASVTLALSRTVLLGGVVTGVALDAVVVGFSASFFVVAFAAVFVFVGAGAFFAFSTFSFAAVLFVLVNLMPVVSAAFVVPTSSVTTFFGRPRFLIAGASIVFGVDMVRGQLFATR
jgi:hypothetical protein